MSNPELDIAKIREEMKALVDNAPDPQAMVDAGLLTYKSGWYEPKNKEVLDALGRYISKVRVTKKGKPEIKLMRFSQRLRDQVKKL